MKRALVFLALLGLALPADASSRLTYLIKDRPTPVAWTPASFPISYTIDQQIVADFPNSHAAVRHAFSAWETTRSAARFQEKDVRVVRAGRDGVTAISVEDDLFKTSGFVAFTTTWFSDDGTIEEADIQFDPALIHDGFDLQAVVQHEVGHLLGLDHSAVLSATMYPFVARGAAVPIDSDDAIALAEMYPSQSTEETVGFRGEVRGQNGPLFGAHVVAIDARGSAIASRLTDAEGRFEMKGLPTGAYQLYVEPLDGPVEPRNFSGVWTGCGPQAFRTSFFDEAQMKIGTLAVSVNPAPTTLNPRWVGAFSPQSNDIRLATTAASLRAGETIAIAVGGDGFVSGMTTFEVLGGAVKRISDFRYGSNYLWATFQVAGDIKPGSFTIIARNGDEAAALTGALRVVKGTRSHRARR